MAQQFGHALTVNGPLSGSGSLILLGSGMLTLTGANTYSGNTTVDGGTLQLSAGLLSSPGQFVGNAGSGSFVQSGGTNTPGGELYLGNAPAQAEPIASAAALCRRQRKSSVTREAAASRNPAGRMRWAAFVLRIQRLWWRILWPEQRTAFGDLRVRRPVRKRQPRAVGRKQFRVQFVPRSQR